MPCAEQSRIYNVRHLFAILKSEYMLHGTVGSIFRDLDVQVAWGVACGLHGGRVIEIHPQKIWGNWRSGYALDFHTTSSTPIGENAYGHMQFDTVRPPVAELLYRLKYRSDESAIAEISAAASAFLRQQDKGFDLLIPVPPSTSRCLQPVILLAQAIGAEIRIPVVSCVTTTRATSQLKNITDPDERVEALTGLYSVDAEWTREKSILLFDDLFRSGSTLNAISTLLQAEGSAAQVDVLTVTRTRSNQ